MILTPLMTPAIYLTVFCLTLMTRRITQALILDHALTIVPGCGGRYSGLLVIVMALLLLRVVWSLLRALSRTALHSRGRYLCYGSELVYRWSLHAASALFLCSLASNPS